MNIIADIAGRFDELMALMNKMPEDAFVFVGDIIDRGKKSKEVIEWCIAHPEVTVLKGNHEHMMLDFCGVYGGKYPNMAFYEYGIWEWNGGEETIQSYLTEHKLLYRNISYEDIMKVIPKEHIKWMENLPLYHEDEKIFVSHAPLMGFGTWENNIKRAIEPEDLSRSSSIIWNRTRPSQHEKFQIFGHNASEEVVWYDRDFNNFANPNKIKPWAICIDTSLGNKLTGINTETMELFEQDYI